MTKLVLNPSRLKDFAACKFRFFTKYIRMLTAPFRTSAPRELGTFVHAGEAAVDENKNIGAAIAKSMKKFKLSAGYQPRDLSILQQLTHEAEKIVKGGIWTDGKGKQSSSDSYAVWKRANFKNAKILSTEKRFFTDIGPVILAPRLDMVLETSYFSGPDELEVWAVEKKSTSKWAGEGQAQTQWLNRWLMDVQTTIQFVVLDREFSDVKGVMIQPIVYSRQNRKNWEKTTPQPIGKVSRPPLKWTRKPKAVIAHFLAWMEDISKEIEQRTESNYWPTDGMASGSCDFCDIQAFCRNEGNLERREPDDIDKYLQKKGRK